MGRYRVSATATIRTAPQQVYRVLADYRQHHPQIVPPKYFRNLQVLEGGVGAGTRTRFDAHVMGVTREVRHIISEPEPGRVLVESDVEGTSVTTFTVDPLEGGAATRLTIDTELPARDGVIGALERWITSALLRRIYREELARIAAYAPSATV